MTATTRRAAEAEPMGVWAERTGARLRAAIRHRLGRRPTLTVADGTLRIYTHDRGEVDTIAAMLEEAGHGRVAVTVNRDNVRRAVLGVLADREGRSIGKVGSPQFLQLADDFTDAVIATLDIVAV